MKRSITLLFTMLIALGAIAQNANMVFFCQEGEAFYVIMNGLRQNDNPMTNVRITDVAPAAYKIKIIFANPDEGELDKTVYPNPGEEITFNIKKKKKSKLKAHMESTANAHKFSSAEDNGPNLRWVMRIQSVVALAQAPPPPANQRVIVYHTSPTPPPPATTTNVVVTEQTTTVHSTPPAGTTTTDNVNINMGVDGFGLNMNVTATESNSNTSATYTETTTTTTTSGGGYSEPVASTPAYQMPGYNGPVGCPLPMHDSDFRSAKGSISSKSFDDTRLQIAKQIINSNCLTSGQVKEIMMIFSFEDSKLDFAKYAYGYTYDLGNYYKVNDAFDFESSIDELNDYINAR